MTPLYVDKTKHKTFHIKRKKRTEPFNMETEHFHENYEIYYLISGERNVFIKDRTHTVRSGDLVFIEAYDLHRTTTTHTAEHDRIVIHFNKKLLSPDLLSLHEQLLRPFQLESKVFPLQPNDRPIVENLLMTMLNESKLHLTGHELYMQVLMFHLLFYFNRLTQYERCHHDTYTNPLHLKIYEAASYINENYAQKLNLHMMSEKLYISPSYFSRMFKEVTAFHFVEYINHVRVKEAQKLLNETNMKIIDISEQVGFDSLTHFGRVFKQVTQTTPMAYRKR